VIFATIGSAEPFDRLLGALDGLAVDEELVVQCGASRARPPGATCVEFMGYGELVDRIRDARVVITHAGVGSVLACLTNGKRPVVVPRLARFREAVDDHQLEFARRLEQAGLVVLVDDTAELPAALAVASEPLGRVGGETPLVAELRAYLRDQIGAGRPALATEPR